MAGCQLIKAKENDDAKKNQKRNYSENFIISGHIWLKKQKENYFCDTL